MKQMLTSPKKRHHGELMHVQEVDWVTLEQKK